MCLTRAVGKIFSHSVLDIATPQPSAPPPPSICMNTIRTAAYAAVDATTSNGRFTVAVDMATMKTIMKPVIILSRVSLEETFSSHHNGANSMTRPMSMMAPVVSVSNIWLLEYTVAADLMCRSGTSFALKILQRCNFRQASSHWPKGARLRELMEIKSLAWVANSASVGTIAPRSSQLFTLSTWRLSARGLIRILEKASMN
jgi:hypothetical protein